MKKVLGFCSLLLLVSCKSEVPPTPENISRLAASTTPLFVSAPCKTATASDRPADGDAVEYNLVDHEGSIQNNITRRLVINSALPNEDRYSEYMVSAGFPPMLGEVGHQKYGFIPSRTGERIMNFTKLDEAVNGLEPGKPVDIPLEEILGDSRTSGTATLTLTGCGTLNERMGFLQGDAVHIYRLVLPYSATPGSDAFDAAVEFEYAVVDRLNWPAIIRSPGSDMIMTSLTKAGA